MTGDGDRVTADPGGFRTYVRRRGRQTRGQARALRELADRFLVDEAAAGGPDPARWFGRAAPLGMEIGFGMGQALVAWSRQRPDWNLIGVEVYQPGIGSAMLALEAVESDNVRLLEAPAEWVLTHMIGPSMLEEVRVFFPDPWPKKRHHKRRLIQPAFARLVAERLRPGGLLWVATDWQDYAQWILDVLDAEPELSRQRTVRVEGEDSVAVAGEATDAGRAPDRPRTRFEARGRRLGHRVWDLRYERKR